MMKPDQERVKNLLLDTVTLLCKNSLQFENQLRVEGLLGIAIDDKDVFFLHISENFKSAAYLERLEADANACQKDDVAESGECHSPSSKCPDQEEVLQEPQVKLNDSVTSQSGESPNHQRDDVTIKTETQDVISDDEDVMITGSSDLNPPDSVAQQATMVAGKRRAMRRPHSPSKSSNSPVVQGHTSEMNESEYANNAYSHQEEGDLARSTSYDHYDSGGSFKQETDWDEPPNKRQASSGTTHPWPNVAGFGELVAQVAQTTFHESEDSQLSTGGDMSQPGCSSWSSQMSSGLAAPKLSAQETTEESKEDLSSDDKHQQALWISTGEGTPKNLDPMESPPHLHSQYSDAPPEMMSPESPYRYHHPRSKHRDTRTHSCDVCAKTFKRVSHLQRHKLTHTGEKPHKCPVCGSRFARTDKLKNHMTTHHRIDSAMHPGMFQRLDYQPST